jgi:type IV secretory pathway VirB6-like protein
LLAKVATFEGHNFDVFSGISAPLIAYLCFTRRLLPKWVALLWNFAGLLVLAATVFVIVTSVYTPGIWHLPENATGSSGLGKFPYTFLGGILMPMAVFMHVLSIKRLLRKA